MERIDLAAQYAPIEMALHSCRYLPARDMVAGKKVLDIACGEGVGVGLLLAWGAAEVVGVDLSQAAISAAQAVFGDNPKARFVCSDAFDFLEEFGADFDIIISVETIEHLPDPEAFLKKLAERRRADATLIVSCPNDYFYYGRGTSINPYHMTQFSFYDFRTMAEKHLGGAAWYLGTPNNGFSAVAVNSAGKSVKDYATSLDQMTVSTAGTVPGPFLHRDRLKPSNSLFYLGVWSPKKLQKSYQSSFAASSHYRLPGLTNVSTDVSIGRTRRVAFVIDQHEWAFDNIVKNMQPYLAERYSISFFYISDYANKADLLHDVFIANSFDNVHFMWREFLFAILMNTRVVLELVQRSKMTDVEFSRKMAAPVLTTSVYDHLYLREEDIEERQDHLRFVDGYATSSLKLQKAYNQAFDVGPIIEISDGVNTELFAPARAAQAEREVHEDQVIKVGWVGNSSWGQSNASMSDDPKGLHSILVPAIERLALEGYPVALALADRNIRKRDRAEMVTYYGKIDILVCASEAEGTPNPVLEAMASGLPFVSTDVGIVKQAAGQLQSEFILPQRNVLNMYKLLKKLLDDPQARAAVAAENLDRVREWNWDSKTTKWLRLFKQAEHNHATFGQRTRELTILSRLTEWRLKAELAEAQKTAKTSAQQATALEKSKAQERIASVQEARDRTNTALEKTKERISQLEALLATKASTLKDAQQDVQKLKAANATASAEMKSLRARIPITKQRIVKGIKRRMWGK